MQIPPIKRNDELVNRTIEEMFRMEELFPELEAASATDKEGLDRAAYERLAALYKRIAHQGIWQVDNSVRLEQE